MKIIKFHFFISRYLNKNNKVCFSIVLSYNGKKENVRALDKSEFAGRRKIALVHIGMEKKVHCMERKKERKFKAAAFFFVAL